MTVRHARAAEVALVALTAAAALSAREPPAGAGYRSAFVVCCLAAAAVTWLYGRRASPTAARVMVLAVTLRAVAFPMPPTLSDDAYRYVWDGMIQREGHNPYAHRPAAPALGRHHDDPLYERLNSAGYYSIYPPASQLAFRLGAVAYDGHWARSYYVIKAITALAELVGVILLLRLAPAGAAALYALSPLAVIEVAGQGHTEGLAVLGLMLAAWGVGRRRGAVAGAGLAIAGGAKLLPFLLAPFAWRRAGAGVALAVAALGGAMAALYAAPGAAGHIAESLSLYVRSFEFAAGPYLALKAVAEWLGLGDVSKRLGPALGGVFAAGFAALLWRDRRGSASFAAGASALYALFLATATTVHPWYLLPALAVAPMLRRPAAWYWAAAIAPATYLFYTGPAGAYTAAVAAGWLGAGLIALRPAAVDLVLRRRALWKWRWIESALGGIAPGATVLDIGAAEGYVGARAAEAGARVTAADIVDANRTDLPHILFDGARLPLPDRSVEVALLVFVLHHARDPDALLAEAARVAHRVAIVETTPDESRRRRTEALDRLVNRLRPVSLRDEERWLVMRPAAEWRRRVAAAGLEVIVERRRGGPLHPQTLLVTRPVPGPSTGIRADGGTT